MMDNGLQWREGKRTQLGDDHENLMDKYPKLQHLCLHKEFHETTEWSTIKDTPHPPLEPED